MEREEAIKWLKYEKDRIDTEGYCGTKENFARVEAIDKAICSLTKMAQLERDIKGFEGLYKVNALGEIYSVRNDMYLSTYPNEDGYLKVNLSKDGKFSQMKVHTIVAEAFFGERPHGAQINHIDENKENNCVWNLEYVSVSDNINHGTRNAKVAEKLKNNPMFSIPICQCDKQGNVLNKYESISEASRQTGVPQSNISRTLTGKRKSAGGFLWKKGESDDS